MQKLRLVAAALVATLLTGSLTACAEKRCEIGLQDSSPTPPIQVAAVLAPTSNFVDFNSIISAASTSVKADLGFGKLKTATGRELSVVLADGTPALETRGWVDPQGGADYDIETAIETTYGNFDLVNLCAAGDLKAKDDQISTDPETDLLAGLSVAADQLTNDTAEKKIYILGNGIQTAGAIQMQEPGKFPKDETYASELAQGLEDIGALPDLHGARVIWFGLSQVDGKNQKLGQSSSDALAYFWQEVITRSNGVLEIQDIQRKVGSGTPNKNAIKVSTVDAPECKLIVKLYEKDGVRFKPDSDKFVDSSKANSAAERVVTAFQEAQCDTMTVHGYAAAGVDHETYLKDQSKIDRTNESLTLSRAKAFATLLKNAGFEGTIKTEGVGTCGTEWKADGSVAPSLQQLCRRVEVTN